MAKPFDILIFRVCEDIKFKKPLNKYNDFIYLRAPDNEHYQLNDSPHRVIPDIFSNGYIKKFERNK